MDVSSAIVVTGIVAGTGLTCWGWAVWFQNRVVIDRTWRDMAALGGLMALTVACAMFLGTLAYALATSGFGSDPSTPRLLARISAWLCLAALAFSVMGRGKYRFLVLLGAVAFGVLWVMVAIAVP